MDADELAERWGGEADPSSWSGREKLGLMRALGDGRYEVLQPAAAAGRRSSSRALGIPAEQSARDRREGAPPRARASARVFVEPVPGERLEAVQRAGRPEEDWPKVREALERLRPLASEALLAIFQQVMSEAVEEAAGREIQQELQAGARRSGKSSRGRHSARARRSRGRRRGD